MCVLRRDNLQSSQNKQSSIDIQVAKRSQNYTSCKNQVEQLTAFASWLSIPGIEVTTCKNASMHWTACSRYRDKQESHLSTIGPTDSIWTCIWEHTSVLIAATMSFCLHTEENRHAISASSQFRTWTWVRKSVNEAKRFYLHEHELSLQSSRIPSLDHKQARM